VDIILVVPRDRSPVNLLPSLYRRLHALGVLTHDLLISWSSHDRLGLGLAPSDDSTIGASSAYTGGAVCANATSVVDSVEERSSHSLGPRKVAQSLQRKKARRRVVTDSTTDDEESRSPDDAGIEKAASHYCHTYMGVAVCPGLLRPTHRRIDLKCFSAFEAPCALFAWTGNTPLNRSVRLYASRLGYSLDETTLKRIDPALSALREALGKRKVNSQASMAAGHTAHLLSPPPGTVPLRCEYDLFSFLGACDLLVQR
jgi:hypothetical protein